MFSTPNCMNLSMFPLFRWQHLVESVTALDFSPKHYQLQDKLDSWLLESSHSGTVFISGLSFFLCTLTKKGSRIRMEERGRAKREKWPLINGSRERKLDEHFLQKSWKSCCGTWKPKYIRLQQLLNRDAWPACGVGRHLQQVLGHHCKSCHEEGVAHRSQLVLRVTTFLPQGVTLEWSRYSPVLSLRTAD